MTMKQERKPELGKARHKVRQATKKTLSYTATMSRKKGADMQRTFKAVSNFQASQDSLMTAQINYLAIC